jgi:hypothetical protein
MTDTTTATVTAMLDGAPDRIWLSQTMNGYIAMDFPPPQFLAWPEYIRADLHRALAAERDALKAESGKLVALAESASNEWRLALEKSDGDLAMIAALTAERDAAIARAEAEEEEKEGWIDRAEAAEARLAAIVALVETAQWARNRLEIIADQSWHGDGRDLKRSIIGIFADLDAALLACGSSVPAAILTAAKEGRG